MSESTDDAPRPQGAYRTAVVEGGLAMSAGMTPRADGQLTITGVVGRDVGLQAAREAAGLAARNAVAAIVTELGGAGQVRQLMRMTVYVACADDFHELSAVADGASECLQGALPEAGLPVRSAIGVRSLPGGAPVEVDLTAAVGP